MSNSITLQIEGLNADDLSRLSELLNLTPIISQDSPTTRTTEDLVSAAFILGIINAAPPIIKALTDMLTDLRKNRYFTIKLVLDNGETTIEGAATPERIESLAAALKQLRGDKNNA